MARFSKFASLLGMEDDDVGVDVPQDEVAEVQQDMEFEQADGTVDNAIEQTADAGSDTDTLIEIRDIINEKLEDGEGVEETVENIYRRMGIPRRHRVRMVSRESFAGGRSNRLRATKGLVDQLGGVIDSIIDMIRRAWEAIKEFFRNLFGIGVGKLTKLEENASKLLGKLNQASGWKPTGKSSFEMNLSKHFQYRGNTGATSANWKDIYDCWKNHTCYNPTAKYKTFTYEVYNFLNGRVTINVAGLGKGSGAGTVAMDLINIYKGHPEVIGLGVFSEVDNKYSFTDASNISSVTNVPEGDTLATDLKAILKDIVEAANKNNRECLQKVEDSMDKIEDELIKQVEASNKTQLGTEDAIALRNYIQEGSAALKQAVRMLITAYTQGHGKMFDICKKAADEMLVQVSSDARVAGED